MSFVVGSYQAIEHPGAGHRGGPTTMWRGEDLRSGVEVTMTLVPGERVDDARRAIEAVEGIHHPHLLPVIDVVVGEVAAADELSAVICPWPAGGRLADLVARRGRLTVGETLTVLIPITSALVAVHAAGVRHGDVCPETIWFDGDGRPLLGALAVSSMVAQLNEGLPEGSRDVAPEVVRGEAVRRGPVTIAADVFSLGSVALRCLTGRSAWPADDHADVLVQSAAGVWPDPPDDAGPAALIELVRAMLRADPGQRPSAEGVSAALGNISGAAPVVFGSRPALASVSADRWRGWSAAERVERPDAVESQSRSGRRGSPKPQSSQGDSSQRKSSPVVSSQVVSSDVGSSPADSSEANSSRPDSSRSSEKRSGRAWPAPLIQDDDARPRIGTPARAGIALLVGLLITVVAVQVGLWWSGWDNPAGQAAVAAEGAADGTNWLDVVVELDDARGRALAAADPALLADVYVKASPAADADTQTIAALAGQGLRVVDGRHRIVSVTRVDPAAEDSPDPPTVRLAIVDVLPTHPVVDVTGQQVGSTLGRDEERRVLVLSATDGGYLISGVEPG